METTKEHVRTNQPTATDFERWIDDARGGDHFTTSSKCGG